METTEQRSDVHWARIILAGVLVLVIAAIAIDSGDIRIGYVFGDTSAPLFAVLIVTAIVGALIGWLLLHRPHRQHG